MSRGLVVGVVGPQLQVEVEGRELVCGLRGRLKRERRSVTALVVVGDEVEVTLGGDGSGAIEAVLPRRTELSRPGFEGRTRVIAANLDRLVIVEATREPPFNRHLVERFLAVAERAGVSPLLVVNKSELLPPETLETRLGPLRAAGLEVVVTSARTGQGIEALRERLTGRLSAMVGHSGVGKSSLLNALDPALGLRTAELRRGRVRGRHTTTASRLYRLAGGGYLADTPGIRELSLFEEDQGALLAVFPEIEAALPACRFRGCSHSHEPDCAVKEAVARGQIQKDRYEHFLRLSRGD